MASDDEGARLNRDERETRGDRKKKAPKTVRQREAEDPATEWFADEPRTAPVAQSEVPPAAMLQWENRLDKTDEEMRRFRAEYTVQQLETQETLQQIARSVQAILHPTEPRGVSPRERPDPINATYRVRDEVDSSRRPMRGADRQDPFELGKYKPKVLEKYNGVRDSRTLLKWLREMESYLVMSQLGQAH